MWAHDSGAGTNAAPGKACGTPPVRVHRSPRPLPRSRCSRKWAFVLRPLPASSPSMTSHASPSTPVENSWRGCGPGGRSEREPHRRITRTQRASIRDRAALGSRYSMWSNGASTDEPSKDIATLRPLPLMTNTAAFPGTDPGRSTTSWITAARSGVRCAAPASPTASQEPGDQATKAAVRGRNEMSKSMAEKGAGSSAACA